MHPVVAVAVQGQVAAGDAEQQGAGVARDLPLLILLRTQHHQAPHIEAKILHKQKVALT